jgi:hypothetical protein
MDGGSLGGSVGVVVGDILNGAFGGSGGTIDWGSRGDGAGWKR